MHTSTDFVQSNTELFCVIDRNEPVNVQSFNVNNRKWFILLVDALASRHEDISRRGQ